MRDGKICPPGEVGEFVCSGLNNYSMPLLRYATGDYGSIKDVICECGRKLSVIEIYGGRDKDILVTPSGIVNIVSPECISRSIKGIKEFQVIQDAIDDIKVKIVKDTNYEDSDIEKIKSGLVKRLGDDVTIAYEFVSSIPRSRAGKFKFVSSKVPIKFNQAG